MLKKLFTSLFTSYICCLPSFAETLTIATVYNSDMDIMKALSGDFIKQYPNIKLEWVTFDENTLREHVTNDIEKQSGKYDIMTIGLYEVPLWANENKLIPLNDLPNNYDYNDILPAVRNALTVNEQLYAAPFYAESSMVIYRSDLFKNAELTMPKNPTWSFIEKAAALISQNNEGVYGICLRGKAGWGENMALLTSMAHSFGATWFNNEWQPQLTNSAWKNTLSYYVSVLKNYGPPNAVANGFNENLALFKAGKCGIWIDATVAATNVLYDDDSVVAEHVKFALSPHNNLGKGSNWLWAWSLAIPQSTQHIQSAKKFISWATSKHYLKLVAKEKGLSNVPPGTRQSLYQNYQYIKASSFANITLASINSADLTNPAIVPVPYIGIQYVGIKEFQAIGTAVGRQLAVVLAGHMSVEEGLKRSQITVNEILSKKNSSNGISR